MLSSNWDVAKTKKTMQDNVTVIRSVHFFGWDGRFGQKTTKTALLATYIMTPVVMTLLQLVMHDFGVFRICWLTCKREDSTGCCAWNIVLIRIWTFIRGCCAHKHSQYQWDLSPQYHFTPTVLRTNPDGTTADGSQFHSDLKVCIWSSKLALNCLGKCTL